MKQLKTVHGAHYTEQNTGRFKNQKQKQTNHTNAWLSMDLNQSHCKPMKRLLLTFLGLESGTML